jgi:hypothetical protein
MLLYTCDLWPPAAPGPPRRSPRPVRHRPGHFITFCGPRTARAPAAAAARTAAVLRGAVPASMPVHPSPESTGRACQRHRATGEAVRVLKNFCILRSMPHAGRWAVRRAVPAPCDPVRSSRWQRHGPETGNGARTTRPFAYRGQSFVSPFSAAFSWLCALT